MAAVGASGTLCVFAHSSGSATGTFKAYVFARGAGSFDGQAAVAEVSVTAAKKAVGVSCRATNSGLQGDFTSTLQVRVPLPFSPCSPVQCSSALRSRDMCTHCRRCWLALACSCHPRQCWARYQSLRFSSQIACRHIYCCNRGASKRVFGAALHTQPLFPNALRWLNCLCPCRHRQLLPLASLLPALTIG